MRFGVFFLNENGFNTAWTDNIVQYRLYHIGLFI